MTDRSDDASAAIALIKSALNCDWELTLSSKRNPVLRLTDVALGDIEIDNCATALETARDAIKGVAFLRSQADNYRE